MATKVFSIGYQSTTVSGFLQALRDAQVKLLVDVRAVAMSRRPGFAKTALAANLRAAEIDYLHLRKLGTPSDGRIAARAGRHEEMHAIFRAQLATVDAQAELAVLAELVRGGRPLCLMCFEAEAHYCHRTIVAHALSKMVDVEVVELMPDVGESD